jgi:hypothetical protein
MSFDGEHDAMQAQRVGRRVLRLGAGFHDLFLAVTPWAAHTAERERIKLREFRAYAA